MLGPNVMIIPTWNLTRADVTCTSSGESRRRVAWFCSCSMMSLRLVAGGLAALDIRREVRNAQARVPGKPISANRGLNLANRGIHFVPRLDPVPESIININLGIN